MAPTTTRSLGPSSIELDTITSTNPQYIDQDNTNFEDDHTIVQQLKPADGGLAAWRLLLAAFIFEALLWGKSFYCFHSQIHPILHFRFSRGNFYLRLITPTNIHIARLPNFIWGVPELLFHAPTIQRQPQHRAHRNDRPRNFISRSTTLRRHHQTFPQISAPSNLDRLANLHRWPSCWVLR
jgi:hypothetical protein